MMIEQSSQPTPSRSSTRVPDRRDTHLVDLGCRKWDPNEAPGDRSIADWYGWMGGWGPTPGRPILVNAARLAVADRDALLFLDRGAEGNFASPETVECFNLCWEQMVDCYRDPIYSIDEDRRED